MTAARWRNLRREFHARTRGLFWLPCRICGQHWGGHEWIHPDQTIPNLNKPGTNWGICLDCYTAGRHLPLQPRP